MNLKNVPFLKIIELENIRFSIAHRYTGFPGTLRVDFDRDGNKLY